MIKLLWTGLKGAIRRDWPTKSLVLVIAVIALQMTRSKISEQETYHVPVIVTPTQDLGSRVVKVEPGDVAVTLRGSSDQLRALRPGMMSINIRLRGNQSSNEFETVTLKSKMIEGVGRSRVLEFKPSKVRLDYEGEVSRKLAVSKPALVGTPLVGTAKVTWTNTSVVVRGPETQLLKLYDNAIPLTTEKIDVDGRVQSFQRRVRILPPSDMGKVTITPPELVAEVEIAVDTESKDFTDLPVLLTTVSGSGLFLTSDPERVAVRVIGMPEAVNRLAGEKVALVADCRDIESRPGMRGDYELRVVLPPGEDGVTAKASPSTVRVSALRVESVSMPIGGDPGSAEGEAPPSDEAET